MQLVGQIEKGWVFRDACYQEAEVDLIRLLRFSSSSYHWGASHLKPVSWLNGPSLRMSVAHILRLKAVVEFETVLDIAML